MKLPSEADLQYTFMGELHTMRTGERLAIEASGKSSWENYRFEEPEPQQFPTAGELISAAHQRPGAVEPMAEPEKLWQAPPKYSYAQARIMAIEIENARELDRAKSAKDRKSDGYVVPLNYTAQERRAIAAGLSPTSGKQGRVLKPFIDYR